MLLSDQQIELFAIKLALGNNGGTWNEHYTNEQKDYWRNFVASIAATVSAAASGDISNDEILEMKLDDRSNRT